jgi:arabinose-5-phosphate isomerase
MNTVVELAKNTIAVEVAALQSMQARLGEGFAQAVDIIMAMRGRVVVVGMGKSGIVGQKIAATLASTGTPSFFVHPGEAFHGDLGMIRPIDVALLISNSGETEEVLRILPFLQFQQNKIVALTGKPLSTLAKHADVALDVGVEREACNNNLAPTSSTTCTIVMGDALAVALSTAKNFQPEDFARFHPGGSLGRKLLTRVGDVMHKDKLPVCQTTAEFREVVQTITKGRLGMTLVMEGTALQGVITDGDIRRAFDRETDFKLLQAMDIMTSHPRTVRSDMRFADAEDEMRTSKINSLVVTDEPGKVLGILQIYDLVADEPST